MQHELVQLSRAMPGAMFRLCTRTGDLICILSLFAGLAMNPQFVSAAPDCRPAERGRVHFNRGRAASGLFISPAKYKPAADFQISCKVAEA